jgi:hypothetical protein
MAKSGALLDRMRATPSGNWQIGDVQSVCRQHDIGCQPPKGGGSHWKVSDGTQRDILTVPSRRPIKPIYIRRLVRFIEQVLEARNASS